MSLADKALWVIERNSSRELTLGSIAAACNVSRSHLANAFGTASGWPVMAYLRARRLSEAARRLAAGAPDILSVALEFGYGSHEAFTRAFREQFGATPEGQWVAANSWRFGFVISYPEGKESITGYAYEPWHLRWVGTQVAAQVNSSGLTLHEFLDR